MFFDYIMINLKRKLEKYDVHEEVDLRSSRRSSEYSRTTQNSFLIEVEHNSDIDEEIRTEINKRFNRSQVNANYRFPRMSPGPFPSISLQHKSLVPNSYRQPVMKKFVKNIRVVSHTPKPSINQSINFSRPIKLKKQIIDSKPISITPTPMSFSSKPKKPYDFPKLKTSSIKSPYLLTSLKPKIIT